MVKQRLTPMQARLLQNVRFTADPGEPGEHWLWLGRVNNSGYGTLNVYRDGMARPEYAHRESYRQFVGPIPAGHEVDHVETCLAPLCIRPGCLQAIPMPENRALAWRRTQAKRIRRAENGTYAGLAPESQETNGQDH